jgi:hypothetical protein
MLRFLLICLPTNLVHGLIMLTQLTAVMHKLLGNASNVYTCPAEAPLSASRRRFDEVSQTYLTAAAGRPLSCSEATRSTTNDEQLVMFRFTLFLHQEKYISLQVN